MGKSQIICLKEKKEEILMENKNEGMKKEILHLKKEMNIILKSLPLRANMINMVIIF